LVKHQEMAVEPFHNSATPPPDSLQGLLDQYIEELKTKRQKLREKRKPSNKANNANNSENIEDDDIAGEDECEEDDDDDDYDYIEDKLLAQNNNSMQ
jgi:hypothetical protein